MCGRAVQSRTALLSATCLLNSAVDSCNTSSTHESTSRHRQEDTNTTKKDNGLMEYSEKDNWNMSPGMSSVIFRKAQDKKISTKCCFVNEISTWGLVTRPGTKSSPVPVGASKHFSNFMFNARSETVYSKKSFSELALKGNVRKLVQPTFSQKLFCRVIIKRHILME